MLNNIKSSLRTFIRKPAINFINLFGLSISLVVVVLLSLYGYTELTTDRYNPNHSRIYLFQDKESSYVQGLLKDLVDANVSDVEYSVRLTAPWSPVSFKTEGHDPITGKMIYTDADFFNIFPYKSLMGDTRHALETANDIVLSREMALKFFGTTDAVGKTVRLNKENDLRVTAVIEKPVNNTLLNFDVVVTNKLKALKKSSNNEFTSWSTSNFQYFVMLKKGIDRKAALQNIMALFPEERKEKKDFFKLTPLTEVYFSNLTLFGDDFIKQGNRQKIYVLLLVAALVLFIGVVNFINISYSQWLNNIRQTGIRKIVGADRLNIFGRIFTESSLLFLSALILAFLIIPIAGPTVQSFTGINFHLQKALTPGFAMVAIIATLLLSFVFCVIPAYRISVSAAKDNLKKALVVRKPRNTMRAALVILQFTIAIVLIAFTLLVQKQIRFGNEKITFNKENILCVELNRDMYGKKEVVKKILEAKPEVSNISFSDYYPGENISHLGRNENIEGRDTHFEYDFFMADNNLMKLLNTKLIKGRMFDSNLPSDSGKMVVNESFVREHNLKDPIGITFDNGELEIVGVIKDFNYKPIDTKIAPLGIAVGPWVSYCMFKVNKAGLSQWSTFIASLNKELSPLSPDQLINITFFDKAIDDMYKSQIQFRRVFSLFSICAIVLCCMGILAMALFASQQRIKEIGIRKTNGAQISEILAMLNKDFISWVGIAIVIATPIAWYISNKWLQAFAYKTAISWWIFALAGVLALAIALLTVSWQSWRAATRNPVEALRYE